ncbi:MAG: hypothetical protein KC560_09490 [Myxococcales bacterium]|nr:hypothetical protein [Myxococcales bacterium]
MTAERGADAAFAIAAEAVERTTTALAAALAACEALDLGEDMEARLGALLDDRERALVELRARAPLATETSRNAWRERLRESDRDVCELASRARDAAALEVRTARAARRRLRELDAVRPDPPRFVDGRA